MSFGRYLEQVADKNAVECCDRWHGLYHKRAALASRRHRRRHCALRQKISPECMTKSRLCALIKLAKLVAAHWSQPFQEPNLVLSRSHNDLVSFRLGHDSALFRSRLSLGLGLLSAFQGLVPHQGPIMVLSCFDFVSVLVP